MSLVVVVAAAAAAGRLKLVGWYRQPQQQMATSLMVSKIARRLQCLSGGSPLVAATATSQTETLLAFDSPRLGCPPLGSSASRARAVILRASASAGGKKCNKWPAPAIK